MAEKEGAAPASSSIDDVVEVLERDVDRTLIKENLKKTPTERVQALQELQRFAEELQRTGREARRGRG